MAMDQAQTFEWLRERSTRLDAAEATVAELRGEIERLTWYREADEKTITEQGRQIEGYRQALEQEMCKRHQQGWPLNKDCFSPARGSDARCARMRRVLAGKETQGD